MNLIEWLSLATVCLLGAMSPGPSLAVVLAHTLRQGHGSGYAAAISHGVGVGLYGLLTVAGLAALVTNSPVLFSTLQLAGAGYLIFMGIKSLRATSSPLAATDPKLEGERENPWRDGFLVAFLNPKLAVFMLALFSQFLSPDTDWTQRLIMATTVGTLDALWYCAVVMFISRPPVLARLRQASGTIDRVLGVILIVLAITVIISALSG
ncbi:LysE family translocator [Halieaceae bacterium IMCC14734]|uniref:LysE family translocator n=1 Tax=Candidatus Litorirhabdus singularis TaxID=2518993 RepID=A0ABT3TJV5_9GAMM|nr:LysE family translocator [Candidatus Litorirhabdus singularis]MCX2982593.1 LysE family translocator [Candidatus Litorirhabdus singularis]